MRKRHLCLKSQGVHFITIILGGGCLPGWSTKWVSYCKIQGSQALHNHNTQQTTTKMSHRCPTLQLLCPLSPWQQQPQPRLLVPPLPMDPGQACGAWLFLPRLVGSHLGHQNKPHEKIERKMVHRTSVAAVYWQHTTIN
jgi:hypothetical protein